jgi:hypothetical protein
LGDHVHYDGQSWQLVAVNGVWLTLRGSSMRSCAVLLTHLVSAPDFAVLDAAAPVPVVPAALAALEPAELERLRRLEAHIRQIDGTPEFDGTLGDPDAAADPRYDIRTTTVEERVATKVAELAGWPLPALVGR